MSAMVIWQQSLRLDHLAPSAGSPRPGGVRRAACAIVAALCHRRGAAAALVALALPALLGTAALAVDAGVYFVEQQRLQLAADAAAMGAALLLPASPTTSQLQSAALQAAQDATGGGVSGTMAAPVVNATATTVTVTLTSQADAFLTPVLKLAAPSLSARATAGLKASSSCVLALNTSEQDAIQVDNMGVITASGCGIFSNSSASCTGQCSSGAIYLNSGTLSGQSIGAVGSVNESDSGSNTMSPSSPVNGGAAKSDPFAGQTAPSPGTCNFTNASFTAWQSTPYQFTQSQNVFCGNTTIGGNGSTDEFAPGIYYVVNGNLVFNNAIITQAAGVTFVLTGSNPGSFEWTNYSSTPTAMSAPTSGPTAGILVWQTCAAGGSPSSLINDPFAGGSTLSVSGAFYMPCGELDLSNNAHLVAASGQSMSVVADVIHVTGSASIAAASGSTPASSATQVSLMQ